MKVLKVMFKDGRIIGYISKNPVRNGAFRRVSIQIVNRPECRPRARSGYLADSLRMASVGTPE